MSMAFTRLDPEADDFLAGAPGPVAGDLDEVIAGRHRRQRQIEVGRIGLARPRASARALDMGCPARFRSCAVIHRFLPTRRIRRDAQEDSIGARELAHRGRVASAVRLELLEVAQRCARETPPAWRWRLRQRQVGNHDFAHFRCR